MNEYQDFLDFFRLSMNKINNTGIKENIPLKSYTTFKIGGPAKYFFEAKTSDDIKKAVRFAKSEKLSYYIIGNGSNILVSDQGCNGLIIRIASQNIRIADQKIFADAGVPMGKIINDSVKNGLAGLEWMIGIPGTLGGAIRGNAGAFNHSIGEFVEKVVAFDPDVMEERNLSAPECGFSYRYSVFKENNYIILSVVLKLRKGEKEQSEKEIKEIVEKRRQRHPLGPSAGSVFKNPIIKDNQKAFDSILKKYPETEKFKATGKIPAGWLIEEYGLLGKKIGGAMVSSQHGNFIINTGNASSEDVIMLVSLIKQKIRVNFNIQLEEEIQYVGFENG